MGVVTTKDNQNVPVNHVAKKSAPNPIFFREDLELVAKVIAIKKAAAASRGKRGFAYYDERGYPRWNEI